jgi:hypothetical protein
MQENARICVEHFSQVFACDSLRPLQPVWWFWHNFAWMKVQGATEVTQAVHDVFQQDCVGRCFEEIKQVCHVKRDQKGFCPFAVTTGESSK